MARLETTISSPYGPIKSLEGRVPAQAAFEQVRHELELQIIHLKEHLDEFPNWSTRTHRGSQPALSAEEMEAQNG